MHNFPFKRTARRNSDLGCLQILNILNQTVTVTYFVTVEKYVKTSWLRALNSNNPCVPTM